MSPGSPCACLCTCGSCSGGPGLRRGHRPRSAASEPTAPTCPRLIAACGAGHLAWVWVSTRPFPHAAGTVLGTGRKGKYAQVWGPLSLNRPGAQREPEPAGPEHPLHQLPAATNTALGPPVATTMTTLLFPLNAHVRGRLAPLCPAASPRPPPWGRKWLGSGPLRAQIADRPSRLRTTTDIFAANWRRAAPLQWARSEPSH